ncbi:MAG: hypothetical protein MI754_12660 [Chromatiales bacterium]|nr:hypothetical protein [Chromatiales bacterium]
MKSKKSIFALLFGLLLTATLIGSPVFAHGVLKSDGVYDPTMPHSIFNIPPERAS